MQPSLPMGPNEAAAPLLRTQRAQQQVVEEWLSTVPPWYLLGVGPLGTREKRLGCLMTVGS